MDRKQFLKICGVTCLGLSSASIIHSCKPTKQVQATLKNNNLEISKKEFEIIKGDKKTYRKSILTKPEQFDFPIVIYRLSDTTYKALLLRCTHQNSELNLNGDIMTCPAHGSEFNKHGEVIQGPAELQLQSFNVTSDDSILYIHLS